MLSRRLATVFDRGLMFLLRRIPVTNASQKLALRWGFSYQPYPEIVTLRCGKRCRLDKIDFLQLLIRYQGIFEPHCIRIMYRLLCVDSTFLDIGANIGVHTLFATSIIGGVGRIISVEAAPENVQRLRDNLALSFVDNVTVLHCAVGKCRGFTTISMPTGGNSGMYRIGAVSEGQAGQIIVRTVDEIAATENVRKFALIKIDIEGSEFNALQGAANTLNSQRPPLMIELNQEALASFGSNPDDVKQLLHDYGYCGWVIGSRKILRIRNNQHHDCDECLFLHRDDLINRKKLSV